MNDVLLSIVREMKQGLKPFICVRQFDSYIRLFLAKNYRNPLVGEFSGTIQSFALKLLRENLRNLRLMSDQERLFVVSEALRLSGDNHYGKLSYVRIVDERLRNLKEHSLDVEELNRLAESVDDKRLKAKILKTAKVLDIYSSLTGKLGAYDIFSIMDEARGLKTDVDRIYLFMLPHILPKEVEFISSLGREVTVVTADTNNSFFSRLWLDNLRILPREWNILRISPPQEAKNFKFNAPKVSEGRIRFRKASFSTMSEAVKLAANCVKYLIARGVEPNRIAITGRELEGIEVLIYDMLRKFGIPINLQTRGIPLLSNPVIKYFMNVLEHFRTGVEVDRDPFKGSSSILDLVERHSKLPLKGWLKLLLLSFDLLEGEERVKDQVKKVLNEIENLESKGILRSEDVRREELKEKLVHLFSNRFYLIEENEPFGVHVCSPEAVPSINPKAVIVFNLSEGVYPRAFPFDPDFSFEEREKVNRLISNGNLMLEPLASRMRLISYEFTTFYNLLSTSPEDVIFLFGTRGKSLFVNMVERVANVEELERKAFSNTSLNCYMVYRGKKEPESLPEKGVDAWIRKLKGEKEFNFIIKPSTVKRYLPNLSVTDIVSYLNCPTDFMFRKLLRHEEPHSVETIEGIIYHEMINRLLGFEFDNSVFEEVFNRFVPENPKIQYLKPFIRENIRKFLLLFRDDELFSSRAEREKPLTVRIAEFCLRGRADWVVKDGDSYRVADFKRSSVSDRDYAPGKKKACQVVLYGLSLFEEDVIRSFKRGNYMRVDFSFVSVPKISRRGTSWKLSFSGNRNRNGILNNLAWSYLSLKLINSGFFIPYEISPYRKPYRGKLFSMRRTGNCSYDCYLPSDYIDECVRKVEEKLNEVKDKLFH